MIELFRAVGLGLIVLMPLANPLTAIAMFLAMAGNMNKQQRDSIAFRTGINVFIIMLVAYYAGQVVMNTFGISIPGLRIAGGMIVAFIGFRMLFPVAKAPATTLVAESNVGPDTNIAFVPLAMPGTAGPGTIAMIISSASTVRHSDDFPQWVLYAAPPLIFLIISLILWVSLRSSGSIMRIVGKAGMDAISRLMGFLLVCMGVQFIINGVLEIVKS